MFRSPRHPANEGRQGKTTVVFTNTATITPAGPTVKSRQIFGSCSYCESPILVPLTQFTIAQNGDDYRDFCAVAKAIQRYPDKAVTPPLTLEGLHPAVGEIGVQFSCKHWIHLKCLVQNQHPATRRPAGNCKKTKGCLYIIARQSRPGMVANPSYNPNGSAYEEPVAGGGGRKQPLPGIYAAARSSASARPLRQQSPYDLATDDSGMPLQPIHGSEAPPLAVAVYDLARDTSGSRSPSRTSMEETSFGFEGHSLPPLQPPGTGPDLTTALDAALAPVKTWLTAGDDSHV